MSTESIKNFIEQIGDSQANAINVAKKILEDGKEEVTVTLQKKMAMPERMESPARAYVFHDAEGFVEYLNANKTKNTVVLADIDKLCISAILDDKAERGVEVISMIPQWHPQFKVLYETLIYPRHFSISDFAKRVIQNRKIIVGADNQNSQAWDFILSIQQITVSQEITQCFGDGKTSINGVICKSKIAGQIGENKIELPDSFDVKVPIYLDTEEVQFGVDIAITTEGGYGPCVSVSAPELDIRKIEAFEEVFEPIEEMEGVIVAYGRPNMIDWKYNRPY